VGSGRIGCCCDCRERAEAECLAPMLSSVSATANNSVSEDTSCVSNKFIASVAVICGDRIGGGVLERLAPTQDSSSRCGGTEATKEVALPERRSIGVTVT